MYTEQADGDAKLYRGLFNPAFWSVAQFPGCTLPSTSNNII